MLIKSLCLGPGPLSPAALREAAQRLRREAAGVRVVQALRVLRHIPTDSVNDSKAPTGVTAEADAIQCILELYFDDAQAAARAASGRGWQAFLRDVEVQARILFSLDTLPNIPIPPVAGAVNGGFRRWMLLTRKAATADQFRDAWFGRHAALVQQLPRVDGYLQNLVTARHDAQGRAIAYEALPVDGIAELCFADEAAMNASYASPARLPLRDDGRELLGRITTVLVDGVVLA